MTIAAREGVAGSRKLLYPPPSCKLHADLYIPNLCIVRRLSFQACSCRNPIGRSDSRPERSIVRCCRLKSAHIRVIKTDTKCALVRKETHYEAAAALSICGAARQKPGRVILRHFCDWLWSLSVQCKPAASQSPEAQLRATVMDRRGRLREGVGAAELVLQLIRAGLGKKASVTAAQRHRSCRVWLRILAEGAPYLAGTVSQLLSGQARELGREGVRTQGRRAEYA